MKRTRMFLMVLTMLLVLALVMAGCDNDDPKETTPEETIMVEETTAVEETSAAMETEEETESETKTDVESETEAEESKTEVFETEVHETEVYETEVRETEVHETEVLVTEPPHEHVWNEWFQVNEATCTEAGSEERLCACGAVESREVLARGHEEVIDSAVEPTCTKTGLTEGLHCSVCDTVLVVQKIVSTREHEYVNKVCIYCGEKCYSRGLDFISNGDGTCYVAGIGTCSDTNIVVPEKSPTGDHVKSIGFHAFYGCKSFSSIELPDSVTSIDLHAFENCQGLANIVIPDSVTSIGIYAFQNCTGLTSVKIGNGVQNIGNWAYSGCINLVNITVADDNPIYHDDGNCIIETAAKTLVVGCKTSKIPADGSVTSIGEYAFNRCDGLVNIEIPNNITSIEWGAFYNCQGLSSIEIPDSVTEIQSSAFQYCNNLVSITVADGNPVYHGEGNCIIETDSKTLIVGCKASVIPTDGSVTYIGGSAFYGCAITSIVIPDGVMGIGDDAFCQCMDLSAIEIFGSVVSIGERAFFNCIRLSSVEMHEGVTSIGVFAFSQCRVLTNIKIPNSVTYIGSEAFFYSDRLLDKENGVTYVDKWVVDCDDSITSVRLRVNTIGISECAFLGCTNLTSIVFPDSVTSISGSAFLSCSSLTNVTIGNNVTSLGDGVFFGCSALTNVTIGNGVTSIGDSAFFKCSSLTSITIPDSVTSIGHSAFFKCSGLTNITISNSVTSIGDYAFTECDSLTDVYFAGTEKEWTSIHMNQGNSLLTSATIHYNYTPET